MNRPLLHALMAACLLTSASPSLHAEKTSANDSRLKWALEKFPQADTNKDGILTETEGQDFLSNAGDALMRLVSPTGLKPTHADIAYGDHARQKLDLYLADSDKPTPLVFYIHGGGFRQHGTASSTSGD